jgi:hypothetical protein
MVRCNGEVCGAAFDHAQHGGKHASDRADLAAVLNTGGRQGVVVPEQFVCAVDQINVQGVPPRTTLYEPWRINQPKIGNAYTMPLPVRSVNSGEVGSPIVPSSGRRLSWRSSRCSVLDSILV